MIQPKVVGRHITSRARCDQISSQQSATRLGCSLWSVPALINMSVFGTSLEGEHPDEEGEPGKKAATRRHTEARA